jgi:hypothetical protein
MLKKNAIIGIFITIFAIFPANAATVSVLVMETARPQGDPTGQYSIMWENGLLEVFFETGHIVTNSPRVPIDGKAPDGFPHEAEKDFENAQQGGLDYFLIAIVDYSLSNVSLRLFNTRSPQMIREQKYPVTVSKDDKEEYAKIKTAVEAMTVYMK